ncbi:MAG: hypothetical protein ACFE8G_13675 [Candidatus Hermodarchaeota archaeon]
MSIIYFWRFSQIFYSHKVYPIECVQFHPESIKMEPYGTKILKNFLKL